MIRSAGYRVPCCLLERKGIYEKKEKKYLLRLDKNGKRIDLTEQGRINISNSKTGEKNPNYVNIDLNIQNEILKQLHLNLKYFYQLDNFLLLLFLNLLSAS